MSLNSGETLQPFKALNQLIFDSSGNLIGIQNDRAVGNDLRIGGGGGVDGTFATLIATTALKLNSGATFDLYNTADQTTNYERLRADWSSNLARIGTQNGGTGSFRDLRIGVFNGASQQSYINLTVSGPASYLTGGSSATTAHNFLSTAGNSSGTQTSVSLTPTINQSGTAGATILNVDSTVSATGSGSYLAQRWGWNGSTIAQINLNGTFRSLSGIINPSTYSFEASYSAGADLTLARDAADTLALRRTTNAQTFRVYNTYTDGSNYERSELAWSGNVFYLQTNQAGTGSARSMQIGPAGSAILYFSTGGTAKWQVSASGHFLANTDNAYDIGASGATRPRNVYVAGSVVVANRIFFPAYTVAGLPAVAGSIYSRVFVTDSTVTAAGNFGAVVAGGGANIVPVFSDGTNWRIG